MATLTVNDVQLYYETHGEGPPLLLIAGLASDSQSWQPIMAGLLSSFRVVVPDNRGVGRTKPPDAEITIRKIADDCMALIRCLELPSVNLLGHSMGGFVALDLAIRYPGCVNKLILAGTSASNSRRNNALLSDWASYLESGMDLRLWFRNIFYWIFSARFFEDEAAVNDAVWLAVEYPYRQSAIAFRNQVKAIASYNGSEGLSGLTSKTMVISGKEDLLFPPGACASLAQAIPGAALTVIDNAAHAIHIEQPRAFTERVTDFLLQR